MNNITAFNAMDSAGLDALTQDADARSGQVMLQKVCDLLGRFVCYPSSHAQVAHALWCVHTHLMEKWDVTPRIAFLSPEPASGKTRALEITELLVPNPVPAINVSPAYLFRKVGRETRSEDQRARHHPRNRASAVRACFWGSSGHPSIRNAFADDPLNFLNRNTLPIGAEGYPPDFARSDPSPDRAR